MTGGVEVSLHVLTPSKDGIPGNSQVDSSADAFHQKRSLDSLTPSFQWWIPFCEATQRNDCQRGWDAQCRYQWYPLNVKHHGMNRAWNFEIYTVQISSNDDIKPLVFEPVWRCVWHVVLRFKSSDRVRPQKGATVRLRQLPRSGNSAVEPRPNECHSAGARTAHGQMEHDGAILWIFYIILCCSMLLSSHVDTWYTWWSNMIQLW